MKLTLKTGPLRWKPKLTQKKHTFNTRSFYSAPMARTWVYLKEVQ